MTKKLLILFPIITILITGFLLRRVLYQQRSLLFESNDILSPTPRKPRFTPHPPTLDQIFGEDHSWTATLSAERVGVLVATGDVIPARSVNFQTVKRGSFRWPFEKTADILKKADITLINLESPLVENCPLTNEGMVFCGDPGHLEGLIYAGVDVANLANNHLGNYGEEGIGSTINLLKKASILSAGISGPVFKDVRGLRFAFLGYNDVGYPEKILAWAEEERIISEISKAREKADVVIVSFHWGIEYTEQPTKRQRELAHLAIDSGADLIIGNHSHRIQPLEIYKGKLITYAHGNFVFDQMWSERTKQGVVGRYSFYDDELIDVEFFPVLIKDYGQPHFLDSEGKRRVFKEMKQVSLRLSLIDSN